MKTFLVYEHIASVHTKLAAVLDQVHHTRHLLNCATTALFNSSDGLSKSKYVTMVHYERAIVLSQPSSIEKKNYKY